MMDVRNKDLSRHGKDPGEEEDMLVPKDGVRVEKEEEIEASRPITGREEVQVLHTSFIGENWTSQDGKSTQFVGYP